MPDSVGKRQRRDAKAKKAAAREDRRLARAKRQADREAGLIEAGTPIQASEPAALGLLPRDDEAGASVEDVAPDEPAGDQA
ncbi:MAG TPA: hypothetical protein VFT27_14570 [Actinomycetota bacterium]|nr:hypothetical protein [Actinomycetota bacterium]